MKTQTNKRKKLDKPTAKMTELLRATGSANLQESTNASRALAVALQIPLQKGILRGDNVTNIYTPEVLEPDATAEYPLDFFRLANDGDYDAYTIPAEGALPTRHIEGDVVTVQTYSIGNAIDWLLKYSRSARWNIVSRALDVLEAGFQKKMNTDGWRTIIAAGAGRTEGIVADSTAAAGQFTKRLISVMKTSMRRLGGGNTGSLNRYRLTDLYISPEALEDIREWGNDPLTEERIDPFTMREIFLSEGEDTVLTSIYGVRLHALDELGEDQEYQVFYDQIGSMDTSDVEIVVGLDLQRPESFVMPIRQQLEVTEDPALHRRQRAGFYAWMELGFACLDSRNVLIGSF